METTRGVLYIVTGDKFLRAAIHSARSVRKIDPGLGIHLFTGQPNSALLAANRGVFDSVEPIEQPHRRSKLEYLARSPFAQTLYLDSDTEVIAPVTPVFGILDRFDMALCHAHIRNSVRTTQPWKTQLPPSYPQFNGGVILYKKNAKTDGLFAAWLEAFNQAGFPQDQITLRECLWASDVRLFTLPPEYNVRFAKYLWLWSENEVQPRILHMQKFHDGPLFFLKNWFRSFVRAGLGLFGLKAADLRKK